MDCIDSTSDWAKRHILEVEEDTLYVVSAKEQTKGRGRWGRSWVSPAGKNLYVTLVFFSNQTAFACTQIVALIVQRLLQEAGVYAEIKWPNDILVNEHKIAGILAERFDSRTMIGVGLNVNMSQSDCKNIPQKATSMSCEANCSFELEALIARFVSLFVQEYEKATRFGFHEVAKSWHEKVQWMISRPVSVQTEAGRLSGRLLELNFDGTCLFLTENGEKISLSSGDIQI
jgi:BirA family biotin operon repressor/biotin-[acetyl-CoA-carboxylase] ligase